MSVRRRFLEWLAHDLLGWGLPDGFVGHDGWSSWSTCRRCGERILRDGRGGWFHFEAPE